MGDIATTLQHPAGLAAGGSSVGDFVALLKPRVMSLVVFTGFVGYALAPGAVHPVLAAVAILCLAIGSGAAGAINMWYERDLDALMRRTAARPLPAGRLGPDEALAFGVILAAGSVALMGLVANWWAAGLLLSAIAYYVFIYTIWLKRRTPQNIVVGGAAGAFPPLIGWAAAGGGLDPLPLVLFLLIFMWTPPHFWALSLVTSEDYTRARIPMLPVVAGTRETRRQILVYALTMAPVALAPWALGDAGLFSYAIPAALLSLAFVAGAVAVWREAAGTRAARRLFGFSVLYLFMIFALLLLQAGGGALGTFA